MEHFSFDNQPSLALAQASGFLRAGLYDQSLISPAHVWNGDAIEPMLAVSLVSDPDPAEWHNTSIQLPNFPNPGATPVARSSGPSKDDWAAHQMRIKQLYLDENKKLREVMDIMKTEFNFHATVKMYKSRLTRWGYVKNNKEANVRSILRLKKRRDDLGKPTLIRNNGRVVSFERMQTYLRRKGISLEGVLDGPEPDGGMESLTSYMLCRTPSPAPSFVRSPDVYRCSEVVITVSRNYVRSTYDSCNFRAYEIEMLRTCLSHWDNTTVELRNLILACSSLFGHEEFEHGGRLLRKAAKQIERIVRLQPREVFVAFFETILRMHSKWPDATMILLKHAVNLSRIQVESPQHPLRNLLEQLTSCEVSELLPTTLAAFRCYLESWEALIGAESLTILHCWVTLAQLSEFHPLPAHIEQRLEHVLLRSEAEFGERDVRTLTALETLADYEYLKVQGSETALDIVQRRYEQILERVDADAMPYRKYWAEYSLARIHCHGEDLVAAEKYMCAAIKTLHSLGDPKRLAQIIRDYMLLEGWLEDQGEHQKAVETRQQRMALLLPLGQNELMDSGVDFMETA